MKVTIFELAVDRVCNSCKHLINDSEFGDHLCNKDNVIITFIDEKPHFEDKFLGFVEITKCNK